MVYIYIYIYIQFVTDQNLKIRLVDKQTKEVLITEAMDILHFQEDCMRIGQYDHNTVCQDLPQQLELIRADNLLP